MQRRPLEEASLVEQETDDDHGDERAGGVPHDVPDHGNIGQVDDAGQQRNNGASGRTPPDAKAARLPDDKHQCHEKDQECNQHGQPWESIDEME
jgi:hypothetical protein